MPRTVFHFEVPDFAVTVERVRDRALATRPVVIAPPGQPRGLVLAASHEAQQAGVVRGMTLAAAERLCPTATVLAPDRLLYRRATTALVDLLGEFTPVVEGTRNGRFFLVQPRPDEVTGQLPAVDLSQPAELSEFFST